MVQLRPVEGLTTSFPWVEPPDKASSSESAPSGAEEPTPIPEIVLGGGFTFGTTPGTGLDATVEGATRRNRFPAARSGPVHVLQTTTQVGEESTGRGTGPTSGTGARLTARARPTLTLLAGRHRVVTEYEPHLRRATVDELSDLFERLRAAIGEPETAARVSGLRRFLSIAYIESAAIPETRSFASAISLLQDFLRPHWSEISGKKIDDVAAALGWLRELPDLSPQQLEKLHERLARVLGGLSFEIPDDEEAPAEPA